MGRRALILLVLLAAPLARAADTGAISGEVRFLGGSAADDRAQAVVWLIGFNQPPPKDVPRIQQKNKQFSRDVLPIVAGQSVEFPNDDTILHNVFSTSRARPFDLGKFRMGESKRVEFPKTGVVDVYCDIHEEMAATILVLPNRAFATTGPDGKFVINDVPAGTWSLRAWHRRASPAALEVTVEPGKQTQVTVELHRVDAVTKHLDKHGRPYKNRAGYSGKDKR